MGKLITIIQGHPDPDVARLEFPLIRTRREFEKGKPPQAIREAQDDIRWANHLVICYPLWLGTLPALLKGFFEQTFRYGYALDTGSKGGRLRRLLKGRSARVIVTMGMPAAVYRLYFRARWLEQIRDLGRHAR